MSPQWIERVALESNADITIIELGGTVGDIEGMPFIEALRQLSWRVGAENFVDLHVSLVPIAVDEQKTKPTQTTVARLRQLGLTPDFIVCRSAMPLLPQTKSKIAMFCQTSEDHVIGVHDVSNLYGVPLLLEQQNLSGMLRQRLGLNSAREQPDLTAWRHLSTTADEVAAMADESAVRVAFVGKYCELRDAYKSLIKALKHASLAVRHQVKLLFVDAELLQSVPDSATLDQKSAAADAWAQLRSAHAVLVPGGFGERGVEGKIKAVEFARVNLVPYFGICLGLQVAVIESARNVMKLAAGSEEFDKSQQSYNADEQRLARSLGDGSDDENEFSRDENRVNVIVFMPEGSKTHMGGTMRLGARTTIIHDPECISARLYGARRVDERHRHRYEVAPDLVDRIEQETDLRFVGRDETGQRMEIVEIAQTRHPFFVAVQFHPEFLSRPTRAAPLFVGFVKAGVQFKL